MRLSLLLLCPAILAAQGGPHWGIQGDYFKGQVPDSIVERFEDLVEQPGIDARIYNAGLVRFDPNGSPSWAIEFTKSQITLEGRRVIGPTTQEIRGNGNIRGVMATRYLNFMSRRYFSFGLGFGGGIGKLEASYYRYQVPPGASVIIDRENVDYTVPTFQAIAQVDIRPVRWISLSPFYGMRNGALGGGGAVRIHFTR